MVCALCSYWVVIMLCRRLVGGDNCSSGDVRVIVMTDRGPYCWLIMAGMGNALLGVLDTE